MEPSLSQTQPDFFDAHRGPLERTIELTFQHLQRVLADAFDITPVEQAYQLLQLVPTCSDQARCLMVAELIKLDMARAAQGGLVRSLDFYLPSARTYFPDGQLPLDVVLEEIQVRRQRGEAVQWDSYRTRFPHLAEVLREVLSQATCSTRPMMLNQAPRFQEGQVVDDFTILRSLGSGAFANVYLARQNSMHRLVALKVSVRGSDEPIALSQLDHPSIVRVYDQRTLQAPPVILLYMQFVPGGTLAEVIRATETSEPAQLNGRQLLEAVDRALYAAGQQPPEQSPLRVELEQMDWPQVVAWLGVQLCEGLAAAHRANILHRDVKPANVLLSAEAVPKLADFNISFSGVDGCAGAAAHFGGSLAYMSPEHLEIANPTSLRRPDELDQRADVYSLGIMLWEVWQGARPVPATEMVGNWLSAIDQQLAMRRQTPICRRHFASPADRVLEKGLRAALTLDRHGRPSAQQLATTLRLALVEQTAALFEPAPRSWRARVRRWPVILTTGLIIFLPNGLAGALNYQYNLHTIQSRYPHLESGFVNLSIVINCIAFPIGGLLLIWLAGQVGRSLQRAARRQPITPRDISGAWNLGHRAAMVGGLLWMISGLAFPLILVSWDPQFRTIDAIEFFLSLAICGGFAWIYPFFGVSLVATEAYYPALIATSMNDEGFQPRSARLQTRSMNYMVSAAVVPLCALALLAVRRQSQDAQDMSSLFLLIVVVVTGIALPFAFVAHQRLHQTIHWIGRVFKP